MYNLKRIKEDLSCVEAAESLGIKIQKKGNNYSMLCPAHNDRHFGSCFCYENKWKCFACGAGGDVYSLIHEATGLTNAELFEEAAKLTGNPKRYLEGEQEQIEYHNKRAEFPLTDEELGLIDMKKTYIVNDVKNVGSNDEETNLKKIGYDEDNVVYGRFETLSLYDIYNDDKETINEIIKDKALEKESKIKRLLDINIILPGMNAEDIWLLKNEYRAQLIKLQTIVKKVTA